LARRHLHALGREAISETMLDLDVSHCRHAPNDVQWPRIVRALDEFFAQNQTRLNRLTYWQKALGNLATELKPSAVSMPTPWRAVFRFEHPQLRNIVVSALRKSGFDAGTNYPPLTDFFPKLLQGQSHAAAKKWGRIVMTLWLDQTYDDQRITKAAAIIEKTIADAATACATDN
jgi:hypothetical protein